MNSTSGGSSTPSGGSSMSFLGCGLISITSSGFRNSSSLGSGGAVYIYSTCPNCIDLSFLSLFPKELREPIINMTSNSVSTLIYNSTFVECTSRSGSGGAVYIQNRTTVAVIANGSFVNCKAATSGGALFAIQSYELDVYYSSFSGCAAGVLPDDGWPVESSRSSVDNGRYKSGGGGIYITAVQNVSAFMLGL